MLIYHSAPANDRAFTVPSPLFRISQHSSPPAMSLAKSDIGWGTDVAASTVGKKHESSLSSAKLPNVPVSNWFPGDSSRTRLGLRPKTIGRASSPRPSEAGNEVDQLNVATRILSPTSINGTPRSSADFYSMSNNSTDTFLSESVTQETNRLTRPPAPYRHSSYLTPTRASQLEILMGYGQISGSFVLDGSLINQSLFEEVKGKGIIGGHGGGGVVRSEPTKRDSGLLGSLGWGNIGESLGGLLGGNDLSSIKDSRGSTSSRSIPILSTPQSVLFVDLRLAPGESKSYMYSHPLPKGIPPTHKGRAMKVSYNLVVGTQRAADARRQHQVQQSDIPFRVLTSVDGKPWCIEGKRLQELTHFRSR